MILFTILFIILVVLAILTVLGVAAFVVFGDVIVCVVIIALIIRHFIKKRQ